MPQLKDSERRLAMLIDGDNAQHSLVKYVIEEASRYGRITIRRAYGDWTKSNLSQSNWERVMLDHAIQPRQIWRNTTGKNATDSALIIDAMDILYSENVQGFCIVSSDSDYTSLCTRIREEGFFVMGMGRKGTPKAFINACEVFVYVENLTPSSKPNQPTKPAKPKNTPGPNAKVVKLLRRAFDISEADNGWVHLGGLGNALRVIDPSFDSRTYGHKTLSLLVKSLPDHFTVKTENKTGPMYVRVKTDKGDG